jgi:hypothetical protein
MGSSYQVATSTLTTGQIASPIRTILRKHCRADRPDTGLFRGRNGTRS